MCVSVCEQEALTEAVDFEFQVFSILIYTLCFSFFQGDIGEAQQAVATGEIEDIPCSLVSFHQLL